MIRDHVTEEQRSHLIRKHIERMPSLPTTVTKVLEVCNRPDTSANDLNRVISLDPVLTGQVLMLINSAYYSMSSQISSLTRAIIMLGINTVKNLALSTAILGSVPRRSSSPALSLDAFWTHSLCVGVMAKSMAGLKNIPGPEREEYFVAGLLHDLGKIPLNGCFPEEYQQVLELVRSKQVALPKAEEELFGFTHSLAGGMIAEKWRLSKTLTEIIRFHHNPQQASEDCQSTVSLVSLANIWVNLFELGCAGDRYPDLPGISELFALADIEWSALAVLHPLVQQEIDKAQVFLQIAKGRQ